MKVPPWFPQIAVHVEMRPIFCCDTRLMWEAHEMDTMEVTWLYLSLFRWSWQFRLYMRRRR
jgi:hypothetical protein